MNDQNNRKKRICMVVPAPEVKGGIASVVNGYRGSRLEQDYEIIYVESYRDGGKLAKLFKGIGAYITFLGVMLIHRPDAVHIHSSFGPSYYRKLPFIYMSGWFQVPVINHIHGADFEEFYMQAEGGKQNHIKKIYGKCTRLIALSEEWKERLSLLVPQEKIVVLKNYSVLQEKLIPHPCHNQILFMGALEERKGCFDIPEVLNRVLEKVPHCTLCMAGDGHPAVVAYIKNEFSPKVLDEHVFFPGWVRGEVKDKYLRYSDLFFLPSYQEGMPMAILDAMGYGLPIVSTDVGGISEIVHEGENGYLCKPGDTQAMADRIAALLTDEKTRQAAGEKSRQIIQADYTLEAHLTQLEKLYQEIV